MTGFPEKSTTKKVGYCIHPHIRFRNTNYIYQGQPFPWERLWSWVHYLGLIACTWAEPPSGHSFPRPLCSLAQPAGHISTWRNQNAPTWPGLRASRSPFQKQQWLHPTEVVGEEKKHYLWLWGKMISFQQSPCEMLFEWFHLMQAEHVFFRDRESSVTLFILMFFYCQLSSWGVICRIYLLYD